MNATEWRHLIKTKTSKSKERTNLLDYNCPLLVRFNRHLVILAQLGKRRSAGREVAGSNLDRTNTQGL